MTYLIDTRPRPAGATRHGLDAAIVLVGCGGTGGFVADAVCRLLIGRAATLTLVDPDVVEPHNVLRQNFARREIGEFKALALARRLADRYGREVCASVRPYDREAHAECFAQPAGLSLLIGAVDNAAARRALAATLSGGRWHGGYGYPHQPIWWLDAGNGRNSGQVLLGNATRAGELRDVFIPDGAGGGICRALPAPSFQRPDLLEVPPQPTAVPVLDCAEAVANDEQGATVNQYVAALLAGYVEQLLAGRCRWMRTVFDLDSGLHAAVPADPKLVADLAGLHPNAVVDRSRQAAPIARPHDGARVAAA